MGIVYINAPQFLIDGNAKFRKLMFIKKGGRAVHQGTGMDISRDYLDAELICISNEDEENWIGNYAEGLGFFNIRFAKTDCRKATDEEVRMWRKDHESIKF